MQFSLNEAISHFISLGVEVACSASDRQGSNFESCVWRTVSSQSSHHPQEVLLAQSLKPDSFHFILSLGVDSHIFRANQARELCDIPFQK